MTSHQYPGENYALAKSLQEELTAAQQELARVTAERDELYKKAYTDELTGLPNRSALLERIEDCIQRNPGNFCLIFADLDGLKAVNDSEGGHKEGDQYLRAASDVLKSRLRNRDTPESDEKRKKDLAVRLTARLGGDEFVIVVEDVNAPAQVNSILGRLDETMDQHGLPVSLGAVIHTPDESLKPREAAVKLLADADAQMYAAKQAKNNPPR